MYNGCLLTLGEMFFLKFTFYGKNENFTNRKCSFLVKYVRFIIGDLEICTNDVYDFDAKMTFIGTIF